MFIQKTLQRSCSRLLPETAARFLLLITSLLLAASACAADIKQELTDQVNQPAIEIEETITINETIYRVPAPWAGNRVDAPALDFSSFKMIPLKYARNNMKLYVTVETQKHLVEMLVQAEADGILLEVESGYRSIGYQRRIFKRMLGEGRSFEDIVRYVAPPGYSNHMLGTAVDFYPSNWQFADTQQYQWLKENAGTFNFEETYSKNNPMKMPWESWHWQYLRPAVPE